MIHSNASEITEKLTVIRNILRKQKLAGVRLRGTDWFAWATAGASNVVLLTTDFGIAEVLITLTDAFVLTNNIEAARLEAEELSPGFEIWQGGWHQPHLKESFVKELTQGGLVASDKPQGKEIGLPTELIIEKRTLVPGEMIRYRALGREAAEAMTETLLDARRDWTGYELAARGAAALWARGIHPALTLVGDERRLPIHRHATASANKLGDRAMLVFCARRHGLFANLTRFVYFRDPTAQDVRMKQDVAAIEADILKATKPGVNLGQMFEIMQKTYTNFGYSHEINKHHQGGPTGYLSREEIALPGGQSVLAKGMAIAWNPSLIGTKIEDTVLITDQGLEVLTVDPQWPSFETQGLQRPDYLVRT